MTVLDSLAHTMQGFLHLLGVADEASAATGSATTKTGAEEHMSKSDPRVAQEADRALGSVLFAIEAFGRHGLFVVATKLMPKASSEEKSYVTYSDDALRKLLSRHAKQLRKTNPLA